MSIEYYKYLGTVRLYQFYIILGMEACTSSISTHSWDNWLAG